MGVKPILLIFFFVSLYAFSFDYSQTNSENTIKYFQMEPLNDSLFIKIQTEVFIDPPDPKAEIVVDLRDPQNQTVSIQGVLYPFLAFTPETRAEIIVFPFKINLEENLTLTSVFTDVAKKIRFSKLMEPPTKYQISSTVGYINPYLQIFGGERLGVPIKQDIGISFGMGTPYSGPLETGYIEFNFHILGLKAGIFNLLDGFTELKTENNHNNIYGSLGYQFSYVIPFGNFFEVGFLSTIEKLTTAQLQLIKKSSTVDYSPLVIKGDYVNWEFRFPFRTLGSTRSKVYLASFLNELHIGFSGRELSLAGNTFDFRFDSIIKTKERNNQFVLDVLVQKIFESWAFSAFAIGPSFIITRTTKKLYGITSAFLNIRLKLGTSL